VTVALSLALEIRRFSAATVADLFVLQAGHPYSLVGHIFAHASPWHLLGNVLFLWVFGNAVCAAIGNGAFLAFYLGAGGVVGVVHLALTGSPSSGADGALSALAGLSLAFSPFAPATPASLWLERLTGRARAPLWAVVAFWMLWSGLLLLLGARQGPGAALFAGVAIGVALGSVWVVSGRVAPGDPNEPTLLDLLQRTAPAPLEEPIEPIATPPALPPAEHSAEPLADLESLFAHAPSAERSRIHASRLQLKTRKGPRESKALEVWPEILPDGPYFFFDGSVRHGPVARGEFLQRLATTADTSAWWFWAPPLKEWMRVTELDARSLRVGPRPPSRIV
jgi:membrane associated rhomboid family serine protease